MFKNHLFFVIKNHLKSVYIKRRYKNNYYISVSLAWDPQILKENENFCEKTVLCCEKKNKKIQLIDTIQK